MSAFVAGAGAVLLLIYLLGLFGLIALVRWSDQDRERKALSRTGRLRLAGIYLTWPFQLKSLWLAIKDL